MKERKRFTFLSSKEREQISVLTAQKYSMRRIATVLGRSPSTVSREFKRPETVMHKGCYYAVSTIENIRKKKLNTRKARICDNPKISEYIIKKLELGWSPEIISNTIFNDIGHSIGKDAIYDFIYKCNNHLSKYLTRQHLGRKKQKKNRTKRTLIPNRIDIDFRPKQANERKEIGHFECDTVVSCKGSKSVLLVIADRNSRYTYIKRLDQKTSEQASSALKATLFPYKNLAKTITYDNGCEFTLHEKVNSHLGMKSYFCKPYHSWEKGTVENINGLIRRFFPKGTDFATITDKQIKYVEDWINNRPMKVLKYQTPYQVFNELAAHEFSVAS